MGSFLETVRVNTFLVFSRKFPKKCASRYVLPPNRPMISKPKEWMQIDWGILCTLLLRNIEYYSVFAKVSNVVAHHKNSLNNEGIFKCQYFPRMLAQFWLLKSIFYVLNYQNLSLKKYVIFKLFIIDIFENFNFFEHFITSKSLLEALIFASTNL